MRRWADIGAADRESLATSVEIEVRSRWDALALSESLIPYHSFLVQFERQRWVVHVCVPGRRDEPFDEVLGKIKEWLVDRQLEDVSCRIDGQPFELTERKGVRRASIGAVSHGWHGA